MSTGFENSFRLTANAIADNWLNGRLWPSNPERADSSLLDLGLGIVRTPEVVFPGSADALELSAWSVCCIALARPAIFAGSFAVKHLP